MSTGNTRYYTVDTELSEGNLRFLPAFLKQYYLLQLQKYRTFRDTRIIGKDGRTLLAYSILISEESEHVDVTVEPGIPIKVTMELSSPSIADSLLDQLYEDLFLVVQLFEEKVRKKTLYLAFMPGEKITSEKENAGLRIRVFADSMLPLYVGLLALTFVFFWLLGPYAPIVFVSFSIALAVFSGKLIARAGDWKITENQQEIVLLQYTLSAEELDTFRKNYIRQIPRIRKAIYESSIAKNREPSCENASAIFSDYGIACKSENFQVKRVNLFQIVKKAAESFRLSIPKIAVVNSVIPNAAASGPNSKLGTIMITTSILTQLEEDELTSVIGHEMSHLKSHDSLAMSMVSSAEFLLRFYVFLPYLFVFGLLSFFAYFIIAMGLIYSFGKILEGKADLDSAKAVGQPKAMAEALRKIGFRRLFPLFKREPQFREYRRLEWLQFDPHPPIYFRIAQLENLKEPENLKHTFLKSASENLKGFLKA